MQTAYPLRQVIHWNGTWGRLLMWIVELSQFYVEYRAQGGLKDQVLADFICNSRPTMQMTHGTSLLSQGLLRLLMLSKTVPFGGTFMLTGP